LLQCLYHLLCCCSVSITFCVVAVSLSPFVLLQCLYHFLCCCSVSITFCVVAVSLSPFVLLQCLYHLLYCCSVSITFCVVAVSLSRFVLLQCPYNLLCCAVSGTLCCSVSITFHVVAVSLTFCVVQCLYHRAGLSFASRIFPRSTNFCFFFLIFRGALFLEILAPSLGIFSDWFLAIFFEEELVLLE